MARCSDGLAQQLGESVTPKKNLTQGEIYFLFENYIHHHRRVLPATSNPHPTSLKLVDFIEMINRSFVFSLCRPREMGEK